MIKKPIVISMGEPSGIASEIVLKTWKQRKRLKISPFFIIDNYNRLNSINSLLDLKVKTKEIKKPHEANFYFHDFLPIYNIGKNIKSNLGYPKKENSKFVIESIKKSFDFVKHKEALGMITLPICKKTVKSFGFKFNGQTEFIGHLAKKKIDPKATEIMILTTSKPSDKGKNLIVGLVTTHSPLKNIFKELTKIKLKKKILSFNQSLKTIWNKRNPIIGITSVNPHAGEDGMIGKEEVNIIIPVIKELSLNGLKLEGPLSGDSCFFKTNREKYDGILCMYHDQGLSPLKTLDFYNSINITGGLPILRVSPDHGPAFDIAKKNKAKINSLVSCLKFFENF